MVDRISRFCPLQKKNVNNVIIDLYLISSFIREGCNFLTLSYLAMIPSIGSSNLLNLKRTICMDIDYTVIRDI